MPPAFKNRGSAKILGGSTFALLAPMLAAPFGLSAMCFLRPAPSTPRNPWRVNLRLDPRLKSSATKPSRSHYAALQRGARSSRPWNRLASQPHRRPHAASRLKNGACEDDEPSRNYDPRCHAQTFGGSTSGLTQN